MKRNKKSVLRSQADNLWVLACVKKWGNNCEVCGKVGEQVHHFYHKNSYGYLRYNLNNGIILCKGCHFILHHQDSKKIEEPIIEKRVALGGML